MTYVISFTYPTHQMAYVRLCDRPSDTIREIQDVHPSLPLTVIRRDVNALKREATKKGGALSRRIGSSVVLTIVPPQ